MRSLCLPGKGLDNDGPATKEPWLKSGMLSA